MQSYGDQANEMVTYVTLGLAAVKIWSLLK